MAFTLPELPYDTTALGAVPVGRDVRVPLRQAPQGLHRHPQRDDRGHGRGERLAGGHHPQLGGQEVQPGRPDLEPQPVLGLDGPRRRRRADAARRATRSTRRSARYDKFKEEFKTSATGQFGSGWAWLTLDGGKLAISSTGNADLPMKHGQTAVLTCDVWEHAYYIDYRNARPELRRRLPRPPHQLEAARRRPRLTSVLSLQDPAPTGRTSNGQNGPRSGGLRAGGARPCAVVRRRSAEADLGQTDPGQRLDHVPAGVDLEPAVGELGRRRGGVVVVVQALAGGDERQPLQVAGRVVVRAAAEVVADGVHRGRAAEVQVDVDERGQQADLPAEHDARGCAMPMPSPSRAWS